jgi:hypothetical protein
MRSLDPGRKPCKRNSATEYTRPWITYLLNDAPEDSRAMNQDESNVPGVHGL